MMWVLLDLPDDLLRDLRRTAATEGRRLSELAEASLRRGLVAEPPCSEFELCPSAYENDSAKEDMSLTEALVRAKIS